jgi:NAD(P)-dependent dehydrogenase (short-subunit alcohol dehydrogenase family)
MLQGLDVVYCNLILYFLGLWHVFENLVENILCPSCNTNDDIDLSGKTAVITGCNRGLGKALCFELCKRGCHVILVCRDPAGAHKVVEEVSQLIPICGTLGTCEVVYSDLSRLATVKACVKALKGLLKSRKMNFLICNAGIMAPKHLNITHDGYELQFQVNFLSHVYLAHGVLEQSLVADDGKVVFVSSFAHWGASGNISECFRCLDRYNGKLQYCNTKFFDVLIARELQKRLLQGYYQHNYASIACLSVNPGVVNTKMAREFCINEFPTCVNGIIAAIFGVLYSVTLRKPEKAACLILQALQHQNSSTYISRGPFGSWTPPYLPSKKISEGISAELWESSLDVLRQDGWLL